MWLIIFRDFAVGDALNPQVDALHAVCKSAIHMLVNIVITTMEYLAEDNLNSTELLHRRMKHSYESLNIYVHFDRARQLANGFIYNLARIRTGITYVYE